MLKIDEISIISDKIIVVSGRRSSDIHLTKDNCKLQFNDTKYPVKKIISSSFQVKKVIKFKALCHIEAKIQIPENELVFHALGKTYKHYSGYKHSIKSYLADVYSRDENANFFKTEDIIDILDSINDKDIKVFSYTNTGSKKFGLIKLANNDGGCSSFYISKALTLVDQPARSIINCPIGKSGLKRVFETNATSSITIIQHTESGDCLDLNFDFISRRKAYALMIKKLSRSQRADKNYDFIRMVKNTIQLWNPVKRTSLIKRYNQAQSSKSSGNYELFINEFEPIIEAELSKALRNLDCELQPLISIITPLHHVLNNTFLQLFDSISNQEYKNWEWILIEDCEFIEQTHIQELIKNDARIKLVKPKKGSDAIQMGLQQASGDLISYCNHNDLLSSFALTAIVVAYSNHPKAKWFFSDEDVISPKGVRYDPKLKSAFNPELFKLRNYTNHFSVLKKELLNHIDSIQFPQHNFYLELVSKISADEIVHIPLILYHCRDKETSTSTRLDIGLHSSRIEPVSANKTDIYKSVLVSIIIPFKDNANLLKNCISSIYKTCRAGSFELVLVDNGSTQPEMIALLSTLNKKNEINVINDESGFNFSKLINIGADKARGDCLVLMNNDVEAIETGWLEELRDLAMVESTGCVGCKLLYSDFTIQHVGMALGSGGYVAHSYRGKERDFSDNQERLKGRFNVSSVTAAVLAVRKKVFDRVGGFDENYRVEYNDVDFNLRVFNAGYWNICTCYAELIHFESKTRGRNITPDKKAALDKEKKHFIKNWGKYIKDDPFFHPWLTRMRDDHSFAEPHEWKIDDSVITGRKIEVKEHSFNN